MKTTKNKLDAKTRRNAIKGLKRTITEGSYYWREKAYSTLHALEMGLPLHLGEWKSWAKKGVVR